MKRTFFVSDDGLIGEVFADGSCHIVSLKRVHPGFKIAHMIGPQGEKSGEFLMIPSNSLRARILREQQKVNEYLENRTPPVTKVVLTPTENFEPREAKDWPDTFSFDSQYSNAAVSNVPQSEESRPLEPSEEDGNLEDIVSALRVTCTFGSDQELYEEAWRIMEMRKNRLVSA